ncbi:MAG: cytochrome c oxidase accessory protein CcoG [Oceanicaulis sp.]|jgi:cytochrome c oxidase accessory protein FixG|nr:cytochrome c oxidase accessory protein CcoG [Oceanicaulis sp.]
MNLIKNRPADREQAAEGVETHDAVAVNAAHSRELYKKREPIHPKLVHGKFRFSKWVFMALALAVYYITPFLRWDRGPDAPDQAVLVDFANARFYFFFIEIWPQEVYYITGLLILSALALFLVTALFGRVWCGYACPQTVWTDLFIAVERLFEGDRNKRIMLNRADWSLNKAWRKIGKHAVWIVIAAATGGAWILYFHDAFAVVNNFVTGQAALTSYIFFAVLTFTTYILAGSMREQVCTYMCPWPRIQGALIDKEALSVTYRVDRGEPRGRHKKGESWEGRGDCIDCKACVAACPMGIDIRDGDQLECINCALCIDACDDIMGKIGRPKGLISYDSQDNVERRARDEKPRYRFIRPRTVLYAVLLAAVSGIMLFGLMNRSVLELNASRDRNPNYVRLSDGSVRNGYTLTVLNKSSQPRVYELTIEGDPAMSVRVLGADETSRQLEVGADQTQDFRLYVTLPRDAVDAPSEALTFIVTDNETGEQAQTRSAFQTGETR